MTKERFADGLRGALEEVQGWQRGEVPLETRTVEPTPPSPRGPCDDCTTPIRCGFKGCQAGGHEGPLFSIAHQPAD